MTYGKSGFSPSKWGSFEVRKLDLGSDVSMLGIFRPVMSPCGPVRGVDLLGNLLRFLLPKLGLRKNLWKPINEHTFLPEA